jgi:hypothetical protein
MSIALLACSASRVSFPALMIGLCFFSCPIWRPFSPAVSWCLQSRVLNKKPQATAVGKDDLFQVSGFLLCPSIEAAFVCSLTQCECCTNVALCAVAMLRSDFCGCLWSWLLNCGEPSAIQVNQTFKSQLFRVTINSVQIKETVCRRCLRICPLLGGSCNRLRCSRVWESRAVCPWAKLQLLFGIRACAGRGGQVHAQACRAGPAVLGSSLLRSLAFRSSQSLLFAESHSLFRARCLFYRLPFLVPWCAAIAAFVPLYIVVTTVAVADFRSDVTFLFRSHRVWCLAEKLTAVFPQIDATIVRIMKTRKTMAHNQLMTELVTQLKFPSTVRVGLSFFAFAFLRVKSEDCMLFVVQVSACACSCLRLLAPAVLVASAPAAS